MYTQITQSDFIDAFMTVRPDNFSYEGLVALFEWFEQYEEDIDEAVELDVIAICCDFSEVSLGEVREHYYLLGLDDEQLLEWLEDNTIVIPINDDTVIIQDF